MSGVYIPGMEMPQNCNFCSLCIFRKCLANGDDLTEKETRPRAERRENCPLIPVTDYGRLLTVLKTERECVSRDCDRDCGKCDLALDRADVLAVYDALILMFSVGEVPDAEA